jgi:hypothetical protein
MLDLLRRMLGWFSPPCLQAHRLSAFMFLVLRKPQLDNSRPGFASFWALRVNLPASPVPLVGSLMRHHSLTFPS